MATWAEHRKRKKLVFTDGSGKSKTVNVETFPWEKLDAVKDVKGFWTIKLYSVILTDKEILAAINRGEILISPFDPTCLGTNSYDVHLSPYLATYVDDVLDARQHNAIQHFEMGEEGFVLQPGTLYLGSTVEYTETHATVPFWRANQV